jgi:hypothetical protein
MKKFISVLYISLILNTICAQNEANIWYIPDKIGLDFNSGDPVPFNNEDIYCAPSNSTICDSLGNFLFTCQAGRCYNQYGVIANSENIIGGGRSGIAIVKWPATENLYLIISSVIEHWDDPGLHYSIVDLQANNGLGKAIEVNTKVASCWDSDARVAIVKQENSNNVWVITRKFIEDAMVAFLVDENGFHDNPVISPMPDLDADSHINFGNLKVSPDKKYLVSSYSGLRKFEVCRFNAGNGTCEYLHIQFCPTETLGGLEGVEFSPDGKFLYASYNLLPYEIYDTCKVYQYEMKYATDSLMFHNSALLIGSAIAAVMEIARDGKIYCTTHYLPTGFSVYSLSAIEKPWVRGEGCTLEGNAVNLFPKKLGVGLPNILVDYLLRFEWTGEQCQSYPIQFKPNFIPTPQTIQWNFDDGPGSTSWQLSPNYTFKNPGVHEVKVDVWYPSGRYEHTSREIEISLPLFPSSEMIH